jgi:TM2 domain-containing membrane protein YozV
LAKKSDSKRNQGGRPDGPAYVEPIEVNPVELKDPLLAAFLAWLIPGAGHFYQGRTAKGVLYAVCILGTFFYGLLFLGDGRVVYAAWKPDAFRFPYLCQIGVGLPALPALVQAQRARSGKGKLFGSDFMAPPAPRPNEQSPGELDQWHYELHRFFELGTVYTMIAGLLNFLAIYDAWRGPAFVLVKESSGGGGDSARAEKKDDSGDKSRSARSKAKT